MADEAQLVQEEMQLMRSELADLFEKHCKWLDEEEQALMIWKAKWAPVFTNDEIEEVY